MSDDDKKTIVFKDEEKILLNHDYDGIKELDHPLPFWWIAIFVLCIVHSAGYYFYYEFGSGPTLLGEYEKQVKSITGNKKQNNSGVTKAAGFVASEYDKQNTPDGIKAGQAVYMQSCFSCHGEKAKGLVGPNLIDSYWVYGDGSPSAIYSSIDKGIPNKGMPAWGAIIGKEKTYQLIAYIKSLKGTKVEGAKAPEGKKY